MSEIDGLWPFLEVCLVLSLRDFGIGEVWINWLVLLRVEQPSGSVPHPVASLITLIFI